MTEENALVRAFQLWAQVLGSPPADPDEDFFAVGGRSIKAVELTVIIEAESGQEFDVESWLAKPTPRQLADQLSAQIGTAESAAAEESTPG